MASIFLHCGDGLEGEREGFVFILHSNKKKLRFFCSKVEIWIRRNDKSLLGIFREK